MNKVELLLECKNVLGEGITYSSVNNNLYWLDINNISKLFKLNLSSNKNEIFQLPEIVTASSVKSDDELILASNNGLNLFTISNKKYERIIDIEDQLISNRSNDGGSDAHGRFWLGTMQNNFDKDGNDIPIKKNVVTPNQFLTKLPVDIIGQNMVKIIIKEIILYFLSPLFLIIRFIK